MSEYNRSMQDYFIALENIVHSNRVSIDRPKGSKHPRYPEYIYPLDYGYLEGTSSQDGGGIDVWLGSGDKKHLSGILVIIDPIKKDSEIKVLLGCNQEEMELANKSSNRGSMKAFIVANPKA